MTLEKTRIRVPLPEPLFSIVKSLLSGRDKALFIAAWVDKKSDDEIAEIFAETFGADVVDRLNELESAICELDCKHIDLAAWQAAVEKYQSERNALCHAIKAGLNRR